MCAPAQSAESRWRTTACLALCLLVAIGLRIGVVWQTPVITRDGMLYVGFARMINHGLWLDLVSDWFLFNPYPALIAVLARCGLDYDTAGQLICAVAAGCAVWPLWSWVRDAFDESTAWLASLTYIFHPVLLRFSGQVLREGLYWFLLWASVATAWKLLRYGGWWRAITTGALITLAVLTRLEAAALYLLTALWAWRGLRSPGSERTAVGAVTRWKYWSVTVAILPLTLLSLNLLLIPAGRGWHGCGRWMNQGWKLLTGADTGDWSPAKADPPHFRELAAEQRALAEQLTAPDDVRALAKSLPAWNALGEPNPEVLRLQRFLILADDQRLFLYIGRFFNESWEGLLFPVLFCCVWGLVRGRRTHWNPLRDFPLAVYAAVLSGLMFYHLATEHILEQRYMFCLMPFVFPWSACGSQLVWRDLVAWVSRRSVGWSRGLTPALGCSLLILAALVKLQMGLDGNNKQPQRLVGEQLRRTSTHRLRIAGPETLRRIGHYADADYFVIPRGLNEPIGEWLDQQPVDYVVLGQDEHPVITASQLEQSASRERYRAENIEGVDAVEVQLYQVQPLLQQVSN